MNLDSPQSDYSQTSSRYYEEVSSHINRLVRQFTQHVQGILKDNSCLEEVVQKFDQQLQSYLTMGSPTKQQFECSSDLEALSKKIAVDIREMLAKSQDSGVFKIAIGDALLQYQLVLPRTERGLFSYGTKNLRHMTQHEFSLFLAEIYRQRKMGEGEEEKEGHEGHGGQQGHKGHGGHEVHEGHGGHGGHEGHAVHGGHNERYLQSHAGAIRSQSGYDQKGRSYTDNRAQGENGIGCGEDDHQKCSYKHEDRFECLSQEDEDERPFKNHDQQESRLSTHLAELRHALKLAQVPDSSDLNFEQTLGKAAQVLIQQHADILRLREVEVAYRTEHRRLEELFCSYKETIISMYKQRASLLTLSNLLKACFYRKQEYQTISEVLKALKQGYQNELRTTFNYFERAAGIEKQGFTGLAELAGRVLDAVKNGEGDCARWVKTAIMSECELRHKQGLEEKAERKRIKLLEQQAAKNAQIQAQKDEANQAKREEVKQVKKQMVRQAKQVKREEPKQTKCEVSRQVKKEESRQVLREESKKEESKQLKQSKQAKKQESKQAKKEESKQEKKKQGDGLRKQG